MTEPNKPERDRAREHEEMQAIISKMKDMDGLYNWDQMFMAMLKWEQSTLRRAVEELDAIPETAECGCGHVIRAMLEEAGG